MMTRNTKIALGCGGVGCLGLILLVIVGVVLVVSGVVPAPGIYNPNSNSNYNYNSNSNTNENSNANANDNQNSNSPSAASDSSSMSDDDKHKLFQAAGITKDSALIQRVLRKLGFLTTSGGISDDYEQFVKDHGPWAMRNIGFVRSVLSEDAARAYVDAHIDD
jgi:hypothetical protein